MESMVENRIVVIDQNTQIGEELGKIGFNVKHFNDCKNAIDEGFTSDDIDAVVVDTTTTRDANGIDLIPALRRKLPFIPMVAMVPENEIEKASEALVSGASDYIFKNSVNGLESQRIKTRILENQKRSAKNSFRLGDINVDTSFRAISKGDQRRSLSPTEMSLLKCLADARGTMVNRDVMKKRCWGESKVSDNALNRKLHEVRRALSSLSESVTIKTIYGAGFLLEIQGQ